MAGRDNNWEASVKSQALPLTSVFGVAGASATQAFPLGTKMLDDSGAFGSWSIGAEYEYVKFSGTIAANEVMSSTVNPGEVLQTAATTVGVASRKGVSLYSATTGQFGFICTKGPALVKFSGTGYVLGDAIAPDIAAAGKVIEWTATTTAATLAQLQTLAASMGYALEAESATTASLLKIFVQRCA